MRKFLVAAIPIVTLALFIGVMLSGSILKKPLGKDDDLPKIIDTIIQEVDQEEWDVVRTDCDNLEQVWERIVKRIQFSSERDEINDLSRNLARLRGAVQAEDKVSALMELNEAFNHWEELGN